MEAELLIDNQWTSAQADAEFERINPVTSAVVTRSAAASVSDAAKAAASVGEAFKSWKHSAPGPGSRLCNAWVMAVN